MATWCFTSVLDYVTSADYDPSDRVSYEAALDASDFEAPEEYQAFYRQQFELWAASWVYRIVRYLEDWNVTIHEPISSASTSWYLDITVGENLYAQDVTIRLSDHHAVGRGTQADVFIQWGQGISEDTDLKLISMAIEDAIEEAEYE